MLGVSVIIIINLGMMSSSLTPGFQLYSWVLVGDKGQGLIAQENDCANKDIYFIYHLSS